ncbi:hypothetical protein [Candidatus Hodarchaeum mangrovi]
MKYLKKRRQRGQLQIAETLVAVSLMLVLALLLINAADQSLNPPQSYKFLDRTGYDILSTADEAGYLRPSIYLKFNPIYSDEATYFLSLLDAYITSILSDNYGFILIAHDLVNGVPSDSYNTILGSAADIAALQTGGEGVIINYHLGSYTSAEYGQFQNGYLVKLYLWEKI